MDCARHLPSTTPCGLKLKHEVGGVHPEEQRKDVNRNLGGYGRRGISGWIERVSTSF